MRKTGLCAGFMVSFLVSFCLVCGSSAWADDFKWPRTLTIGTPGTSSGVFAATNGWAPIMHQDTDMRIRVVPEDSETGRYQRLTEFKDFDLAAISIADTRFSQEGIHGYSTTPPHPTRLVWHANDTPWLFVVRGDSDIKTIYDIKKKGVRVSLSSQSPPMMVAVQKALPKFVGWSPEDAKENWIFVPAGSYAENCRSITDGKADITWVAPISSVIYEMEGHPKGIRFLDQPLSDKKGWEGWLSIRPTHIPAKIELGVPSAKGHEGLSSSFNYWGRADLDEELVYRLAKWFHENFDRYKGVHALAPRMSIEMTRWFLDHSPLPVHNGTIRYLREIGKWTAEDDKWNKNAIDLQNRWLAARKAAQEEAKSKGIKMHWENEEFLKIFRKHTEGLPVFKVRL